MFEVQQTASTGWVVVGVAGRALLVEIGSDTARIASFRQALQAGFPETLEALAVDGFARTPAFALAEIAAGHAVVAVRGSVRATVEVGGAERTIDAIGVSTWLEQQIDGARAVALSVTGTPASGGPAPLPLADGAVWASAVSWSHDAPVRVVPAAPPRAAAAPITAPVAIDDEATEAAPQAGASHETRIPEATIAGPAETTGYDHLFGATMMRSVEDAAVRPPDEDAPRGLIDIPGFVSESFPVAAADRAGDHDGMTVLSADLPTPAQRGRVGESTAAPGPAPRFYVDVSDGRREYLVPPIVVGRAPVVSSSGRGAAPRAVTVTSEEQDISRSHVSVAVEGDTVVVTDLHSRNGTIVVLPGKSPQKLRQGEPTAVIAGSLIDLGSGVMLTVGEDG